MESYMLLTALTKEDLTYLLDFFSQFAIPDSEENESETGDEQSIKFESEHDFNAYLKKNELITQTLKDWPSEKLIELIALYYAGKGDYETPESAYKNFEHKSEDREWIFIKLQEKSPLLNSFVTKVLE